MARIYNTIFSLLVKCAISKYRLPSDQVMYKCPETDLGKGLVGDEDWVRRWKVGQTGWHCNTIEPFLASHGHDIFGGRRTRVFVPLCGKARDLSWFRTHGHEVIGVELAEKPVYEFFFENSIDCSVEELKEKGKLYKSGDGCLRIFVANLFNILGKEYGKFHVIWDRRSFTAINRVDHERYRDLMCSLMSTDSVWYLNTVEYDESVWPGPPHSISDKYVHDLFGTVFEVKLVEENEGKNINPNAGEGTKNSKENDGGETTADVSEPRCPSPTHVAIGRSNFIIDRWYKLTIK